MRDSWKFVHLMEKGVFDPKKVVRSALLDAAGVASELEQNLKLLKFLKKKISLGYLKWLEWLKCLE